MKFDTKFNLNSSGLGTGVMYYIKHLGRVVLRGNFRTIRTAVQVFSVNVLRKVVTAGYTYPGQFRAVAGYSAVVTNWMGVYQAEQRTLRPVPHIVGKK